MKKLLSTLILTTTFAVNVVLGITIFNASPAPSTTRSHGNKVRVREKATITFTLGLVITGNSNDFDFADFFSSISEKTTAISYRQLMLFHNSSRTTPSRVAMETDQPLATIRLHVNPVRLNNAVGLDKFIKQLFCSSNSRGTNAVFIIVDNTADNGVLLASFMTMIADFAGLPSIAWSNSEIVELDQATKVALPTLLLAPSVRSQANAIFEFIKNQLPTLKAVTFLSLSANGYEEFGEELKLLASHDETDNKEDKHRFDSHLAHMGTRFSAVFPLTMPSRALIREKLMFLRENQEIRIFVLYTEPAITDMILKEAHLLGMTTTEYFWIGAKPTFVDEAPRNYPPGFIVATYNTSFEVRKVAARGAIRVWREAVRRLALVVNETNKELVPTISCTRFTAPKWKHGQQFHRLLKSRLRKLVFTADDDNGYSSMTELEILGFDLTRRWLKVASWTTRHGIVLKNIEWLKRHEADSSDSLRPRETVRIVTLEEPPFVIYQNKEKNGECSELAVPCRLAPSKHDHDHSDESSLFERKNHTHICCKGFVVDLLKRLSRDLNFNFEMFESPDQKWGTFNKTTQQWSGLLHELLTGKADIVGTSLKINTEREHVIDFSTPFYQTGVTILVRVHEGIASSTAYLKPFTLNIWLSVFLGCVTASALCIFFFEKLNIIVVGKAMIFGRTRYHWTHLFESFWLVYSMLFNATMKTYTPKSTSGRFILNVWAFFCVIFMSSFMANLAASMITKEKYHDFSGINDYRLHNPYTRNPPWTFGTVPHGSSGYIIRNNFPEMYDYMRPFMQIDVEEGANAVLQGKLDAFIYDAAVLTYRAGRSKSCMLKTVGKWFAPTSYGFGMSQSSKWLDRFNQKILKYQSSGFLQQLDEFWTSSSCHQFISDTKKTSTELGVVHLSSLFAVLAIAIAV